MVNKENALEALQTLIRLYGISRVSSKLGYTYAYIHQVATGNLPISAPMKRAVCKVADSEWGDFYEHKPTVTIRYDPGDPRRDRALKLSMEERREALELYQQEIKTESA